MEDKKREMTVEEIGRALASGSEIAIDELYRRAKPGLYNFIFKMCNDRNVTEDIIEDTFLKVVTRRDSYKAQWSVLTWVYTIARNELFEWMRVGKKMVCTTIFDDDGIINEFDACDTEHDMEQEIDDDRKYKAVLNYIKESGNPDLQILQEYYECGKRYKDIATERAMNINSVKTVIRRAKLNISDAWEIGKITC